MSEPGCNGCTACCRRDTIVLVKADAPIDRFRWHKEPASGLVRGAQPGQEAAVLDRNPDGACVYLAQDGCSIHETRPEQCRRFDCRDLYATTPRPERRRMIRINPTLAAVFDAGRARTPGA